MIEKSEEEAREQQKKFKNWMDCLGASDNSWRLSDNFERTCIERNQLTNVEDGSNTNSLVDHQFITESDDYHIA